MRAIEFHSCKENKVTRGTAAESIAPVAGCKICRRCYRDSPKVASKIRKMNIQLYSKRLTANEEGDGHNSLLLRC